jgi:hypothetical protein
MTNEAERLSSIFRPLCTQKDISHGFYRTLKIYTPLMQPRMQPQMIACLAGSSSASEAAASEQWLYGALSTFFFRSPAGVAREISHAAARFLTQFVERPLRICLVPSTGGILPSSCIERSLHFSRAGQPSTLSHAEGSAGWQHRSLDAPELAEWLQSCLRGWPLSAACLAEF